MRILHLCALALLVAATGCDSASDDSIAGTYAASQFIATLDSGETVNVLAAGGSITMTLTSDGRASGRLVVPESLAEDSEPITPFDGTYAVMGDTVTFDHEADTFIRDATWTRSGDQLRTQAFGITVVLGKR